MKRYMGYRRDGNRVIVAVEGQAARDIKAIARMGVPNWKAPLAWGCLGNAATNAALSILADCLGLERAEQLYRRFAVEVVARLDAKSFELSEGDILAWLETSEAA